MYCTLYSVTYRFWWYLRYFGNWAMPLTFWRDKPLLCFRKTPNKQIFAEIIWWNYERLTFGSGIYFTCCWTKFRFLTTCNDFIRPTCIIENITLKNKNKLKYNLIQKTAEFVQEYNGAIMHLPGSIGALSFQNEIWNLILALNNLSNFREIRHFVFAPTVQ